MRDSIEEMLSVTMKRIQYIMQETTSEKALKLEVPNLIDAAIVLLQIGSESISKEKTLEYYNSLLEWAMSLYIASLIRPNYGFTTGQFHASGHLMHMICQCRTEKEVLNKEIKEAGAE